MAFTGLFGPQLDPIRGAEKVVAGRQQAIRDRQAVSDELFATNPDLAFGLQLGRGIGAAAQGLLASRGRAADFPEVQPLLEGERKKQTLRAFIQSEGIDPNDPDNMNSLAQEMFNIGEDALALKAVMASARADEKLAVAERFEREQQFISGRTTAQLVSAEERARLDRESRERIAANRLKGQQQRARNRQKKAINKATTGISVSLTAAQLQQDERFEDLDGLQDFSEGKAAGKGTPGNTLAIVVAGEKARLQSEALQRNEVLGDQQAFNEAVDLVLSSGAVKESREKGILGFGDRFDAEFDTSVWNEFAAAQGLTNSAGQLNDLPAPEDAVSAPGDEPTEAEILEVLAFNNLPDTPENRQKAIDLLKSR